MTQEEEIESLKKQIEELKNSFKIAAYARTNERGDLFDLRLQNNPYVDQKTVVPLYVKADWLNKNKFWSLWVYKGIFWSTMLFKGGI